MADEIAVVPVSPALRDDFFRVHNEPEGCAWCYCVAWHLPTWDGFQERTDPENRAYREALFARGEYDGYLMHVGGEPAGWLQAGPRDRMPKLVAAYALTPDPAVWAVTCLTIRPPFRKRGLAHRLLGDTVADLARRGVARVQGFPRRGETMEDGDAFMGTEALFRAAGFVHETDGPRGPVYACRLP